MENQGLIKTVLLEIHSTVHDWFKNELAFYPEIAIVGCSESYCDSKKKMLQTKPDLVFFDMEIGGKDGVEMLTELKNEGQQTFAIIIITTADNVLINLINEKGIDYLIKPLNRESLKTVIDHFKQQRSWQLSEKFHHAKNADKIALPSSTGLQFIHKRDIVLIQFVNDCLCDRKCWEVMLHNLIIVKLHKETILAEILELLGYESFVQINQSYILNIHFLSAIEFKTRECVLQSPFETIKLSVSRNNMVKLRERFDLL